MKHAHFAIPLLALTLLGCAADKVKITDTVVGKGPAVQSGMVLQVFYTGKLKNGIVFDANEGKRTPFEFQIGAGKVIPGWDQGLIGMKLGGERDLEIPASLAYGDNPTNPIMPPNSDLFFHVKLVGMK